MTTIQQPIPGVIPQLASLYVGSLALTVTEEDLYNNFSTLGRVISVFICRDKNTKQALGYGYVNYANYPDAEKALNTLNYSMIRDKAIRIMWQNKDSTLRKDGVGNVYVRNLADDIDDKTLMDLFSEVGSILSCKVAMDLKSNRSLGYGYVQFSDPLCAKTAIEKMSSRMVHDKPITVEAYKKHSTNDWTNCYFCKVPSTWTEAEVKATFEPYGPVTSILLRSAANDPNKKFGYVNFKEHAHALNAVEGLKNKNLGTEAAPMEMVVSRYETRKEREKAKLERSARNREANQAKSKGKNLYVKNFPPTYTEVELRDVFSKYGTITSSVIMKSADGTSRGFGFVCYNTDEEARKAIEASHTIVLDGRPLYVAFHQTPEERRKAQAMSVNRSFPPNMFTGYPQMMMPMDGRMSAPNMYPVRFVSNYPNPQMQNRRYPPQYQRGPFKSMGMRTQGMNHQQMQQQPMAQAPQRTVRPGPFPQMNPSMGGMNAPQMAGGMIPQPIPQPIPQQMGQRAMQMPMPMMGGQAIVPQMAMQQQIPSMHVEDQQRFEKLKQAMLSTHPLDSRDILNMSSDESRNAIGERLYGLISSIGEPRVAKITGMMLELDSGHLLEIMKNPSELLQKINEAIQVLDSPGNQA